MSQPASLESGAEVVVWDLPLRAFHWLLVASVAAAIATGLAGGAWMAWHGRAGQFIAGLLVFRLTWGLWGTRHARFWHFLPSPRSLAAYLRGRWQGTGHNPLGALSVFAVLGLLIFQVGTGLFSNDEIGFAAPWSGWVSEDASLQSTGWHRAASEWLYAWLGLHLVAVAVYRLLLKRPIVRAMWSGRMPVRAGQHAPAVEAASWQRALLSVAVAVSVQLLI